MQISTQNQVTRDYNSNTSEDIGARQKDVTQIIFDISARHVENKAVMDKDLRDYLAQLGSSDISAQTQSLLIDLIRILAEARRQGRELNQTQNNIALKIAKNAYSHQMSQAKATMTAGIVSASATIVQSAVDLGMAAGSAVWTSRKEAAAKAETDAMDWTKKTDSSASSNDADSNAPPSYTELPQPSGDLKSIDADGKIESLPDSAKKALTGQNPSKDGQGADTAPEIDEVAKAKYLNDRITTLHKKAETGRMIGSQIGTLVGTIIKISATAYEAKATEEQAKAALEKSMEEFIRSQGHLSQEYSQELKDIAQAVVELLRALENARNKAFNGVMQTV